MSAADFIAADKECDKAHELLVTYAKTLHQWADELLESDAILITSVSVIPPKSILNSRKRHAAERLPTAIQLAQAIADCFEAKEKRDQIYDALSSEEQKRLVKSGD